MVQVLSHVSSKLSSLQHRARNPAFRREGVAVADFFARPKTVVGASDQRAAIRVSKIYEAIDEEVIFTSIAAAEMVKYVDNVWHAAKVAFGNEVGRICRSLDIDSHGVMDNFVRDTKLNLSPCYLRPGFAFGGSCLPKEVRAVGHLARSLGVSVPLSDGLLATNRSHVEHALKMLEPYAVKRIGFLGLTLKPGADDLRESLTIELMSVLLERGETLLAFDPNLVRGPMLKLQADYMRHAVPHPARVMDALEMLAVADAKTLIARSDFVVVCHATAAFREALESHPGSTAVVDLARLDQKRASSATYQDIAW